MDLMVCDEYMDELGAYLDKEFEILSDAVDEYIAILRAVSTEGIAEGKTAQALKAFTEQAEALKGMKEHIGAPGRYCREFKSSISKASEKLY